MQKDRVMQCALLCRELNRFAMGWGALASDEDSRPPRLTALFPRRGEGWILAATSSHPVRSPAPSRRELSDRSSGWRQDPRCDLIPPTRLRRSPRRGGRRVPVPGSRSPVAGRPRTGMAGSCRARSARGAPPQSLRSRRLASWSPALAGGELRSRLKIPRPPRGSVQRDGIRQAGIGLEESDGAHRPAGYHLRHFRLSGGSPWGAGSWLIAKTG
jgi:hypothetical protein